ncbi:CoA-transferase [Thermodesulfobacteriota bacterium]
MDFLREIIDSDLAIPVDEGPDKRAQLDEAVARLVEPGMSIHAGITHGRPNAIMHAIARRFWGSDPRFFILSLGFGYNWVALVRGGLVRRVASSFIGDPYPTPGANPVFQRAFREGMVEFENWSILSFTQRLMAAAMGLPWMPTTSIAGSTMAEENAGAFFTVKDETSGDDVGVVRAFAPDLSILHGLAADRQGNTILTPPMGDGAYGAMAARRGSLVTVEKIVSTAFIRRHSHLVKLPGRYVSAVCEEPFGAHPSGVSNSQGIPGVSGYADDYDFYEEVRAASKDGEALDRWIDDWILSTDQEGYLARLGPKRRRSLRDKADGSSWVAEIEPCLPEIRTAAPPNPAELLIAAAGRKLAGIIVERGYDTILAGVGFSNLAAWLAARIVKASGRHLDLMAEIGFYGYNPRPADPFIFNYRNIPTCAMLSDITHIMGVMMSGARNRCIGAFGAAQIDRHGNVNSTMIPGKTFFVGSGGANDVASGASESLVTMIQERDRMIEKVPYITSPGGRIRTVVTTMGVYEKLEGSKELTLTAVIPDTVRADVEALVRRARDNCGWDLQVAREVAVIPLPDRRDVAMLRLWDPRGQFLGKMG